MATAIICSALLGLLVFGLGMAVSSTRGATDQTIGFDPDPRDRLHKIVRAHANTTEYAPMLAVLMLLVGTREPATWVLGTMWVAVASRYSLALGLILSSTLEKPHPLRFVGALGTYLAGIALCVAAVLAI
jgi:hypothetical protein